ncbi:MAG TPA: hypothetical protein VHX59_26390 [Mycobacteriales bacterium]|nr:hypothetical protein [Mycobacteriales bacterium]
MSIGVLVNDGQRVGAFGRYLAEILRGEGLTDQEVVTVAAGLPELDRYDAVVLTRMNPTAAQVAALVSYVDGGGRLIAIRPSILLATALGLTPHLSMTDRAYVRPLTEHRVSAGVPHEPIQTHVPADNYSANLPGGAEVVAELYGNATTGTAFPAALTFPRGSGQVVVFTYDLPHAVSRIRHGDPDRIGGRALGNGLQNRTQDLLIGYADPTCWHLPQADIHAMLLGNAVNAVAAAPQPRWWYYPAPALKSIIVLDSDDDWSRPEAFDALIEAVESFGGHITIYLMLNPSHRTIATPELVEKWRARGHSFGIHHNPYDETYGGADEEEILDRVIRAELTDFRANYGDTVPVTNRNHCIAWSGYVEPAKIYAEVGVDMDLNTVSNGTAWLQYLNGSGRPLRFVDSDGTVIDCFQQLTSAYDDLSVVDRLSGNPAGEAAATRRQMEERLTRYFSPLSMLSHPVSFHSYSREYQTRCWTAARELGIPIWSAFEWAEFVRARDDARIVDARWDGSRWTARIEGRSPQGSLTLMLPVLAKSATVDGSAVDVHRQQAFGYDYTQLVIPVGAERSSHEVSVDV